MKEMKYINESYLKSLKGKTESEISASSWLIATGLAKISESGRKISGGAAKKENENGWPISGEKLKKMTSLISGER
jgi:hypothetical protein